MHKPLAILFFLFLTVAFASAQEIRVNPTGVNVNSQDATSVFLTYAPLRNYRPVDACWCGEIMPAAPDIGFKCNPATIFGCLPARYDRSTQSDVSAFTDIMSIPPSVARRAYQAAQTGVDSRFFYVRHFVSTTGGPDQFVAVTCRLTGGGARTPFSLTNVKLSFDVDKTVLLVKPGEKMPELKAEITYTGTGRLKGRWEVVLPSEQLPEARDLLTEATLPIEQRPLQRRYTQLSRFNIFLTPVGRYVLAGPDVSRLPNTIEGAYLILLRIEASDDKEADSDLSVLGAGPAVVHSGAVAGFPLPALRYFVGVGSALPTSNAAALLMPADNGSFTGTEAIDFKWEEVENAVLYKLELMTNDFEVLTAVLPKGVTTYRAPSWLQDRLRNGDLRWRIVTIDMTGQTMAETVWRRLKLTAKQ